MSTLNPGWMPPVVPPPLPAKRPVLISAVLTVVQGAAGIVPSGMFIQMLAGEPSDEMHMKPFAALSMLLLVVTLGIGVAGLKKGAFALVQAALIANIACSVAWLLFYALPYLNGGLDGSNGLSGIGALFAAFLGVPAALYAVLPIIGLCQVPSDRRKLAGAGQQFPPHPGQQR
jgi:hypothetical protein